MPESSFLLRGNEGEDLWHQGFNLFNLSNAVEFFGLDFFRNLKTFKMTMENLTWHVVFLEKIRIRKFPVVVPL